MKKNRIILSVFVVSVLFLGTSAEAKFGLKVPKAPAANAGEDISGLKANLEETTKNTLKTCFDARALFKESYAELALALGLKDLSNQLRSEAKELKAGNLSTSDLKKEKFISEETNNLIQKKLDSIEELTPEQKTHFWEAVNLLGQGVAMEAAQVQTAIKLGEMAEEITEKASGLEKAGAVAVAKPALDLAMLVPGDLKSATETLNKLKKYATAKNMKIPSAKDADDAI